METYNRFSKHLHWSMAVLFLWQFLAVFLKDFFDETTLGNFLASTHKPVGLLLFVLILVRITWTIISWKSRPARYNIAAAIGHSAMYALMLLIPFTALIRQLGSDRSLDLFGVTVMQGREQEIEWMTSIGGWFHGELAWILLALIVGHVVMAIYHRRQDKNFMKRMM